MQVALRVAWLNAYQNLAVRLTCVGRRPVAALCHKRVELGFVFGDAQAVEELTEFPLLLFETA